MGTDKTVSEVSWRPVVFSLVGVMVGLLLLGCLHEPSQGPSVPKSGILEVDREHPKQARVGETITVSLVVTVKEPLPAVSVKENFDGLTLVDPGVDFLGVVNSTLRGLIIKPAAGIQKTFTYQVKCEYPITYMITAIAESKGVEPVWKTTQITCVSQ